MAERSVQWCPDDEELDLITDRVGDLTECGVTVSVQGGGIILLGDDPDLRVAAAWVEGYVHGRHEAA